MRDPVRRASGLVVLRRYPAYAAGLMLASAALALSTLSGPSLVDAAGTGLLQRQVDAVSLPALAEDRGIVRASVLDPATPELEDVVTDALAALPGGGPRQVVSLTVADNIAVGRGGTRADVVRLAQQLGIEPLLNRYPDEMSLGERQRVGIARTLHVRPRLVILDEPTAHQDAASSVRVLDAAARPPEGSAVVVATHDDAVLDVATRVVRLGAARQ